MPHDMADHPCIWNQSDNWAVAAIYPWWLGMILPNILGIIKIQERGNPGLNQPVQWNNNWVLNTAQLVFGNPDLYSEL